MNAVVDQAQVKKLRVLALVLARAGSKGVPGKNVAPVAGKPCVVWTLEAAQKASCIERVVMSTDDPKAAAIARAMGVGVVDRPVQLAADHATVDDAARHAIATLEQQGEQFDAAVILYANAPVRPEGLIDRAVELLASAACDSVQSYVPVGKYHPWWTAVVDDAGSVSPWLGDVLNHNVFRRQDLPPAHIPDGGVLVVTREALFCEIADVPNGPHRFFGKDRRGVLNKEGAVVDIDAPIDLLVADAILRERMKEQLGAPEVTVRSAEAVPKQTEGVA